MRHLRNESATHSRLQGFLEVLRFAKHVVGLSCQLEAFESAWVAGIVRAAAQNRPLRKQSSVLTVSALQYLEAILEDETVALVDRQVCGWGDPLCNLFSCQVWRPQADCRDCH